MTTNYTKLVALIIDDDEMMLDLAKITLNNLGINNIYTAKQGHDALNILDSDKNINFILCDLNMPQMDGIEFLRHLADRKFLGQIILFSGEDLRVLKTAEIIANQHNLKILGAIEKPIDINKLKKIFESPENLKSEASFKNNKNIFSPQISDLERAILKDEIILYYQPKVSVKTKKIVGFEALARWDHPKYGVLGPEVFIKLAEKNNLIDKITRKLIIKAFKNYKNLELNKLPLTLSINLSPDSLDKLDLPNFIIEFAEKFDISPNNIMFEITESKLIKNLASALEIILRLSLNNFRFSIDDFGTGYSSMKQLEQIPFSELKIDRAFVHNIGDIPKACAILESSVDLAKKMEIESVAEGVETQQDWDLIEKAGCDVVQGFFVSLPLPYEDVKSWMQQWQENNNSPLT